MLKAIKCGTRWRIFYNNPFSDNTNPLSVTTVKTGERIVRDPAQAADYASRSPTSVMLVSTFQHLVLP